MYLKLTDIFLEKDNWFCTIFEKKPSYLSRNFLFVNIVTGLGEMTLPEESEDFNWISQEVVECRFHIFWEGHKKLKKCSTLLLSHTILVTKYIYSVQSIQRKKSQTFHYSNRIKKEVCMLSSRITWVGTREQSYMYIPSKVIIHWRPNSFDCLNSYVKIKVIIHCVANV